MTIQWYAVFAGMTVGAVHYDHTHHAGPQAQGRLQGIRHPRLIGLAAPVYQPVDHDLDGVLLVAVEGGCFVQIVDRAVHAHAHVAGLARILEHLPVLALAVLHDGREDHIARAVGQVEQRIHHLLDGLLGDFATALRAVGHADAGEEQAQVVVHFRDRADRGARIAARAFLVDGDGGREAVDVVHVRLLQHAEKLARVGREGLHVAALSFRKNGIEGQARLAGAGEAGDDHQLLARNVEVDIFQVVFARAANADVLFRHGVGGVSLLVLQDARNLATLNVRVFPIAASNRVRGISCHALRSL